MKSCTCGGVNENCYRCQGSGEVGRRPGQVGRRVHLRSVVRRRVVRASVQSSRPQVAVSGPLPQQKPTGNTPPEGGELRGAAGKNTAANPRLDSSSSPVPKSMVPMRSRAATAAPMKSCPLCNCQVREDKLQKHMSSRCPLRPSKPKRPGKLGRRGGEGHGIAEVFRRLYTSSRPERP